VNYNGKYWKMFRKYIPQKVRVILATPLIIVLALMLGLEGFYHSVKDLYQYIKDIWKGN